MTPEEKQQIIEAILAQLKGVPVKEHYHEGLQSNKLLPSNLDTAIVFNEKGGFGQSEKFTYDKSPGGTVNLGAPDGLGSVLGGDINITPGNGKGAISGGSLYLDPSSDELGNFTGNIITSVNGLPTTSNGGFFIIGNMNNPPTGTPVQAGAIVLDYVHNKLYLYNGSAWKSVTLT